jgi:HPr kinase/phosphorylase
LIVSVKKFFLQSKEFLRLSSLTGKIGFSRQLILTQEDPLPHGCVLVDRSSPLLQGKDLTLIGGDNLCCLIFPAGLPVSAEVVKEARRKRVAIFKSDLPSENLRQKIREVPLLFHEKKSVIPGGLIRVYDYGILIQGDSGIGKSESALELVSRGHKFISDDVTLVEKEEEGKLIGKAPSMSQFFMEIRGLGIINIEKIFGPQAVLDKHPIDMVVNLKRWEEGAEYDRLGLSFPEDCRLLGVCLPKISIPVAPGRNIATLIEVATKVHICRLEGYIAAQDIIERLNQALAKGNNESSK